jgi:hypothetical protein
LRLTGTGWAFYLNLAQLYGWKPRGTLPPKGQSADQWPGHYDSSDGQRVGPEDALTLADALRAAVADASRPMTERDLARRLSEELTTSVGRPVDVDPPSDDVVLRELLNFCLQGSFRIE